MRYPVLLTLLLLFGCFDNQQAEVSSLLDARDAAISNQDLTAYAALLHQEYQRNKGAVIMRQMQQIFLRFDHVIMTSRDREVRIINDHEAMCEQTYVLKVFADGDWREIIQREQLQFQRIHGQWKISAGL